MTAICKVCEAAHAMCLSGDTGAQAADFLKAAIVQERKAKEKAKAEVATLRAEVERLQRIEAAAKAYREAENNEDAACASDVEDPGAANDRTDRAQRALDAALDAAESGE